jgi:hypothetical protein
MFFGGFSYTANPPAFAIASLSCRLRGAQRLGRGRSGAGQQNATSSMPDPARVTSRDQASDRYPEGRQASRFRRSIWSSALAGLLIVFLLGLPAGCQRRQPGAPALQATAPSGPLQEVAPPAGVQQLAAALAEHSPQLRITAPADGATLADGPWSLQLSLRDWPLNDAGELGFGAHVVVQVDDEAPQRVTRPRSGDGDALAVEMPPLSPGSHRITAYAARPWGEVVKDPRAFSQIRLQRVAPTPLRVPAAGTPQLIAVSPGPEPRSEPVLLDWLLIDAPLQGLREGDASWRLRVTVNGDSFLVDQNAPLWLRGWRQGSNSLQLDLVDGLGEPLNPPFNSLVSEVVVSPAAPRPVWLTDRVEPDSLARLLGRQSEAPVPPMPGQPDAAAGPASPGIAEAEAPVEPSSEPQPSAATEPESGNGSEQPAEPETTPSSEPPSVSNPDDVPDDTAAPAASPLADPGDADRGTPNTAPPTEAITAAPPPPPPLSADAERIAPNSSLSGSARDQVRDDGSLIQPKAKGPLAGLRERLGS